jgi:hypothetical protein
MYYAGVFQENCLIILILNKSHPFYIDWSKDAVIKQEVVERTNRLLPFDTTRTAWKPTRPKILILLGVYSLPRQRFYEAVA